MPASVRRALGLKPGAVIEWVQERDHVIVLRAARHGSQEVHEALFPGGEAPPQPAPSLEELKQGLRRHIRHRHAGD